MPDRATVPTGRFGEVTLVARCVSCLVCVLVLGCAEPRKKTFDLGGESQDAGEAVDDWRKTRRKPPRVMDGGATVPTESASTGAAARRDGGPFGADTDDGGA